MDLYGVILFSLGRVGQFFESVATQTAEVGPLIPYRYGGNIEVPTELFPASIVSHPDQNLSGRS